MQSVQISVLIRNLNEAKSLEQTLLALKRQRTDFEYEIVVIDNESDDNSMNVALQMDCKVFTLKRNEFTFGHSLNYGIEKCKGEIILILSAHVILLNEFFLQNIPQYFDNAKVAALRFVHAVSTEQVADSLQNGHKELIYSNDPNFAVDNWKNFAVNHCAAIKRSCWEQVNFNEQIFASEDKMWNIEILKRGYSILYDVPCFYVYTKPFSRKIKTERAIIEESAKQIITGYQEPFFSGSYTKTLFIKIRSSLKKLLEEIKMHKKIYYGIKAVKRKYKTDSINNNNKSASSKKSISQVKLKVDTE